MSTPDFAELDRILRESAQDAALDDDEKNELRQLGETLGRDRARYLRNRAFDLVRERCASIAAAPSSSDVLALLRWLEQVVRTLEAAGEQRPSAESHAYFAPGEDCLRRLRELCNGAKRTIDVCVYTISDDRLSDALTDAHRRGVAVRILSDDHKAHDAGSDVLRLRDRGLAVRFDDTPFHMHHKFALFDGRRLASGSFNWTRSASDGSEENLVVSDDPRLARDFAAQFERMWGRFGAE
jgi:phosphatidylserine/phosphatidylglycerophosphate/cardiolipin synthase-like enzyme